MSLQSLMSPDAASSSKNPDPDATRAAAGGQQDQVREDAEQERRRAGGRPRPGSAAGAAEVSEGAEDVARGQPTTNDVVGDTAERRAGGQAADGIRRLGQAGASGSSGIEGSV